jgi:predicted ATP-grasp superfamily ATP-dependent carboligase
MSHRTTLRTPAVIVGIDCITGLQTARLLRARGVPVHGVASNARHFAARTNACQSVVEASTSGPELIPALLELAGRLDTRAVLYPCTDPSVLTISAQRRKLESDYFVALPEHNIVEMLMSKPSMVRHASEQGYRVPASLDLFSRADLEQALDTLRFPCVLKPALKDARWFANTRSKAFRVESKEELRARYEECASFSRHLVVQEWIEGPESALFSCNCYFGSNGEPLVSFVARKIRQWPPETGTSAFGIECRADEVRSETLRLFRGVGFHGLGYVEMKRDSRTGEYFLIEPNIGRPTGRSAICEAGGVELLYTMYCDLTGAPLPEAREQTYGDARWIYLRHDLQAALREVRAGRLSPGGWWRSLRGGPTAFALLSWRDPLPFVYDLRKACGAALGAVGGRIRRRREPAAGDIAHAGIGGGRG